MCSFFLCFSPRLQLLALPVLVGTVHFKLASRTYQLYNLSKPNASLQLTRIAEPGRFFAANSGHLLTSPGQEISGGWTCRPGAPRSPPRFSLSAFLLSPLLVLLALGTSHTHQPLLLLLLLAELSLPTAVSDICSALYFVHSIKMSEIFVMDSDCWDQVKPMGIAQCVSWAIVFWSYSWIL